MRWVTTEHWWIQLEGVSEWVCKKCDSRSKRVNGTFYDYRSEDVSKCEVEYAEDNKH